MYVTLILLFLSIITIASISLYGCICYLIGGITLTNEILKELFFIRFSQKVQKKIVNELSKLLDKIIKEELRAIADNDNQTLIEDIGENLTNSEINHFKRNLKEIYRSQEPILTDESIMLICKKLSLFSFTKNLNRFIRYIPQVEVPKNNNYKESKDTKSLISFVKKFIINQLESKLQPLVEPLINVKHLYDSSRHFAFS